MMKLITKTAVVAAGVSLVSAAAQAAFTPNDLYLGFNQSSASSDYIINLGQASAVGVGGSSVVDLSGYFDTVTFNSIFTGGATGVSIGVVGGQAQFPSSYNIYATALRIGGPGNPAVAGSDLSSAFHSSGVISSSISDLGQLTLPSAGDDVSDAGKNWGSHVLTLATGSFFGDSGINPASTIDGSGVIYEDLWRATAGSAYTYLGYFTFDASGPGSITFTPVAVPEPEAAALLGVAGILCFVFRRRLNLKNA